VITIKSLTTDDWRLWRELRLAALAEAPYAFGSRYADWVDAADDRWQARLARPGWVHLIAHLDDQPVGMATGVPIEDPGPIDQPGVAELLSFWVAPQARGAGVAARLVSAVETWADERGTTVLRLSVRPDNDRAIAFYRRYGFADTGRPGDALPDGRHELIFEKPVERAA
jgi:ribosomal protein S18 acetylase RimI-like enzyme